ncbi:MAG: nucleoside recognition domain-containing protein [Fibrobacterota bacterium]
MKQEKSSPINIIWLSMILISVSVATFTGTIEAMNEALFDSAKDAVTLALGLIGPMALWLGLMKIAEAGGLMKIISRAVRPVMSRLFPEIPSEHPAMSAIILNMSANMLGLGNAATPMGIKAMQELDKLNPRKGEATNSMALFLAINTSSVTLLPLGVITVRASAGSDAPAAILLPSLFATTCSTIMAVCACKFMEKKNPSPVYTPEEIRQAAEENTPADASSEAPPEAGAPRGMGRWFVTALLISIPVAVLYRFVTSQAFQHALEGDLSLLFSREIFFSLSTFLIPALIVFLISFGYFRGVKVYETLTDGAREGFQTAIRIIPFMVAIIVAIGMVRASGTLELLSQTLNPLTQAIGMPIEALSLAFMRPLSGNGSFAMMAEIISNNPNSFLADLVSSMQGSTETTFYVLAVYFGAVGIKRTRHALPAALLADLTGVIAAFLAVKWIFS